MAKHKDRKSDKKSKSIYKRSSVFRRYFGFTAAIVLGCMIILGLIMMIFVSTQWWNEKTNTLINNARNIIEVAEDFDYSEKQNNPSVKKMLGNLLYTISGATSSEFFITDSQGNVVICENDYNGDCEKHKSMKIP